MTYKYKLLWGVSVIGIFFETYRQFMSYFFFLRSYIYFLLWFFLSFVFISHFLKKINYIPVFVFLIVVLLYILREGDYENINSFSRLISLAVSYMIIPTVCLYYIKYCTIRQISVCLCIILIVTTYTMICTIPVALFQPGLIREAAGKTVELYQQLELLGVMNYALPHSVVFIIPALCFGIKYCRTKLYKVICILVLIETFYIIYLGEATTPLLLGVIALIISLIYNVHKNFKINVVRIGIVSLLLLLIMNEAVVLFLIDKIDPIFEETAFSEKTHELRTMMTYGAVKSGGDVETRQDFINMTVSAIFENTFIGTLNSKSLGGHNYLLDIFASIGLLGFIPFIIWLFYIIKKICFLLPNYCRFYFMLGITVFLIHALTKNIWSGEFFLYSFFILPCLLFYISRKSTLFINID